MTGIYPLIGSPELAMPSHPISMSHSRYPKTMRRDTWWKTPALVFLGLSTFIIYSTWAAFQGAHYTFGPYLSPFYSPELFGTSEHAWFGLRPEFWPNWLPYSPALLILWAPASFRLTCYYYRGAYYKAFWADPPSCAVSEPRKSYRGENSFPLILQNIHRYTLYLAMAFMVTLSWDAIKGYVFDGGIGIGVGFVGVDRQRHPSGRLHLRVSFPAPPGWRGVEPLFPIALPAMRLEGRDLSQQETPDVGLVEPLLGRVYRSLRPPLLDGRLD